MKQLVIFIFLFSSVLSFGQTKPKDISGLYGKCKDGFYACTQLHLKTDSTFEYGIFYDVGGWNIYTGTWRLEENTLILNSYKQPISNADKELVRISYSFIYSGFITNLKHKVIGRKIYTWDFEKKKFSTDFYLKKTKLKEKLFEVKE